MNAADLPFESSLAALSEIEGNAKIRSAFDGLILPYAQVFYTSEYVDGDAKASFRELLKFKTNDATAVYRGLLVLVCSVIEYFCKQVIENAVLERASDSKFSELPPGLVASNFAYTGKFFLSDRDLYLDGAGRPTFEELARALATCKPGDERVELNAKMFTQFLGNCTPAQLETRFSELALGEPFGDAIGGTAELKSHFGGGGAREVAKKTRETLHRLIERRNSLVHSSTISETVTVDEVLQAAGFGKALFSGIKKIVEAA